MPPRPIHHWKSFWLGIIALLCLAVAWQRSRHYSDELSFDLGPHGLYIFIEHEAGKVSLQWSSGTSPNWPRAYSVPLRSRQPRFPSAASISWHDGSVRPFRSGQLTFAHWYLILLFFLAWLAFLIWRRRRMKPFGANIHPPSETPTKTES
ncbi:hypothetical protein [Luteolibacter soli]|uniref:DUF3592 domain-containing protein n=1 Tax=Luteolibacter soli TaxID=3135280 RepID=A0ABU9AXZ5_9BACT